MTLQNCNFIPKLQYLYVIAVFYPKILEKKFINLSIMTKEDILSVKNDIKAFKRVRRCVGELIINFPDDADKIWQQEEFIQLSNARIFLDKTIFRLENLVKKATNP